MSQIDKNSVKILVVDDEDYMREIVRQALEMPAIMLMRRRMEMPDSDAAPVCL